MAVYTTLSESQVNEMLLHYGLPALHHMEGAGDGIENTTYFLTVTDKRRFVLTLFEMLDAQHLPPYIQLTRHYAGHGLPVPCPLPDINGNALQHMAHKPALLFPRAAGRHAMKPSIQRCAALGNILAHLHLASADFPLQIPNPCGLPWAEETAARLISHLDHDNRKLLDEQLALGRAIQLHSLPRGIIHGDLFKDNALFDGSQISAIIDFYNAGTDCFLLDLAIAVNDWCFDEKNLHDERQSALMKAYQSVRPLSPEEIAAWPDCLQWAACRFWLSRLKAAFYPQHQREIKPKDPEQYRNLLLFYRKNRR